MSNFSFSHSVFKRLILQTRKNQGLFGKGLTQQIVYPVIMVNKISGNDKYVQLLENGFKDFQIFNISDCCK